MNEDLWGSVQHALDQSRYFVLMASTRAAASPWVAREVEYWVTKHGTSSLFIVLTEGAIRWNAQIGDFDADATTAVPSCLFGKFSREPLWADVESVRTLAARGQRNDRLRDAARSLAAAVYGISKDEIDSDDERESKRARRFLRGSVTGLAVLTVLSVAAALVAIAQTNEANAQLRVATARAIAGEADNLGVREPALSARLAVTAYKLDPSPQTSAALMRAYERNRHIIRYIERAPGTLDGIDPATGNEYANGVAVSDDGAVVAVAAGGEADIRLWDTRSGLLIRTFRTTVTSNGNQPPSLTFTTNGKLIVQFQSGLNIWDVSSGAQLFSGELNSGSILAVSDDGNRAATLVSESGRDSVAGVVDLTESGAPPRVLGPGAEGSARAVREVRGGEAPSLESVYPDPNQILEGAFTPGGTLAAVLLDNDRLELWDLATRARLAARTLPGDPGWVALGISADGSTIVVGNDNGELIRLNAALTLVEPLAQLPSGVHQIRFGVHSGDVAVAVDDAGTVVLTAPLTDRRVDSLQGVQGSVVDGSQEQPNLVASKDGRWIAAERVDSVQLWQVGSKKLVGEFPLGPVYGGPRSSFNAEGTLFSYVTGGGVAVRELPSGREISTVSATDPLEILRAIQRGVGGIQLMLVSRDRVWFTWRCCRRAS